MKTIIERLELLEPLIKFEKDDFFFVQIFQRRKDVPELDLNVKRLKSYSFYSWEELKNQAERIQEICDLNQARAYIRLNSQNSVDVSLRCIAEMTQNLLDGNPSKNKGVWDSVSGKKGRKDWWVLDIDVEHLSFKYGDKFTIDQVLCADIIEHFQNRGFTEEDLDKKIIYNPTKSGYHLILPPFDTRILEKYNKKLSSAGVETIKIQKDCNTILYIGQQKTK